jgi:hypothetical protein
MVGSVTAHPLDLHRTQAPLRGSAQRRLVQDNNADQLNQQRGRIGLDRER